MRWILLILLLVSKLGNAQYANSLNPYLKLNVENPAFTGGNINPKVSMGFIAQWPSSEAFSSNTFLNLESSLPQFKSSFGLAFENNNLAYGVFKRNKVDLSYAYQLTLTEDIFARFGLLGTFRNYGYDFTNSLFPDQLLNGSGSPTSEPLDSYGGSQLSFGSGILIGSKDFFIGAGVDQLTLNNDAFDQRLFSMQAAYKIRFDNGVYNRSKFDTRVIQLSAFYKKYGPFQQFSIGGFGTYAPLTFGLFYHGLPFSKDVANNSQNNVLSLLAGYRQADLKLSYNIGLPLGIIPSTGLSHQITISYSLQDVEVLVGRKRSKNMIKVLSF